MPNYELFHQFNEYINVVTNNATWTELPWFSRYFNSSTQAATLQTFPKFVFFSAHAETVYPLFVGFGKRKITRPAPGSAIFMEFFE